MSEPRGPLNQGELQAFTFIEKHDPAEEPIARTVLALNAALIAMTKERDELKFLIDDLAKRTLPGECDSGDALLKLIRELRGTTP